NYYVNKSHIKPLYICIIIDNLYITIFFTYFFLCEVLHKQNKFQQVVVEASKKLPSITQEQIQWGYQNCIEHIGQRTTKGKITCTECNHVFTGDEGELQCPNCKTKLKVQTTNKRIFKGCEYLCFITTCQGYQVIRYLMIKCTAKVGSYPEYTHAEVMQRWIAPDGRYCTFAKLRQTMGTMYYDSWIFSTPLELRSEVDAYNRLFPYYYYPKQQLIPELKRTGIKKRHFNQRPFDVYRALLKDNRMETLLKSGQIHLFKAFLSDTSRKLDNYWASIRICIRNGYTIKDATLWFDYIDYLRMFGKDLHNAKYVCPNDLHKEHDRYMQKKAKADAQKEIEKLREKEETFRQTKAKFFGLIFSDGLIQVRVLESIEEIILEGKLMHHYAQYTVMCSVWKKILFPNQIAIKH
ncbi:PcfJ domain-containing protein, partial [Dysgonomonas mossii]|uniref:PcfJ domain-containing protein n=1 Tax=Dysgonomonas mossii TaxID=163665 RepID=UPI00035D3952